MAYSCENKTHKNVYAVKAGSYIVGESKRSGTATEESKQISIANTKSIIIKSNKTIKSISSKIYHNPDYNIVGRYYNCVITI